jgi:SAM-dependent methyltransferase
LQTCGMETSVPLTQFESAYAEGFPPWVINEPQPAIVELERGGWITSDVLDAGCGTGEHTILLARLGYRALGVDFAASAIEHARANAASQGVDARFEVADVLQLGDELRFDTVVDSALFHVFGPADRMAYARSLRRVCRPGALVHILALSDAGPGLGPQISDTAIREAFTEGWQLEEMRPSRYRVIVPPYVDQQLGLEVNRPADIIAWLARYRRTA